MEELTARPATLDDAAFAADLWTALRPEAPTDPLVTRYWWEVGSSNWHVERFLVEREGRPVGYAEVEHPTWEIAPDRRANVYADLLPLERGPNVLMELLGRMEERGRAAGARILRARANENDPLRIEVIRARGYREDRRGRRWELAGLSDAPGHPRDPELVDRLVAMAEESRTRMRAQGVRLLTLAEHPDPKKYVKIWRMSEEASEDVPTTLPRVPESLEDYLRWFRAPDMRDDRFWIARLDDAIVGCSVLTYPPIRGLVGTAWTATARSVRGRGIARALKCETVMQALALGVTRVRTGNDAENAPILHINETMGYRPVPGAIDFLKPA